MSLTVFLWFTLLQFTLLVILPLSIWLIVWRLRLGIFRPSDAAENLIDSRRNNPSHAFEDALKR